MKSSKNTGNDGWYLYTHDGQKMLSWYFQEDSHVLQLQNTYSSWNLDTVHYVVRWCVMFSPKSSERWWLQEKLSDTSNREQQPAIPHNNHLTSEIKSNKVINFHKAKLWMPSIQNSFLTWEHTSMWKSASILVYTTKVVTEIPLVINNQSE